MSNPHFFPQPQPLQDRFYKIQREWVDRNPSGFGYLRGSKQEELRDESDFLRMYRRKFPHTRIETLMEMAKESFRRSVNHPDYVYYNRPEELYLYERPYNLDE